MIIVAVLLAVIAPLGVRAVVVQDSWINGFAQDSEFSQAVRLFNEQFLGMHILLVCVDAGASVLTGEIQSDSLEPNGLRLPADLVDDPQSLIGREIRLTTPAIPPLTKGESGGLSPLAEGDDPSIPSLPRGGKGGSNPAGANEPPRRSRRFTWHSWIEAVHRDGNEILLTVQKKHGPPRLGLRARNQETFQYEILRQPFMSPDVLRRVDALATYISAQREDTVGGVIGPADYVMTTNLMSRGLKESARRIPEQPDRIDWLWRQYRRIRGTFRLRQIVDETYGRSLVTVFLKDANFVSTARLMDKIREYERAHLKPHGIHVEFAGDVAVSQTLISAIVTTQVRSLLLSLVGIFAVTALLGRSLAWGLLCVAPCTLAVLMNFAFMGLTGMPLGVATSMFAGMTLGIGVDYAIHLLERYRFARREGLTDSEAIADAVRATGPAILIDAVAVGLGFGVLVLSQVPANARLGALVVLSIATCLATTLILLPALLHSASRWLHVGTCNAIDRGEAFGP